MKATSLVTLSLAVSLAPLANASGQTPLGAGHGCSWFDSLTTVTRPPVPVATGGTSSGTLPPVIMRVICAEERSTGMGKMLHVWVDSLRTAVERDKLNEHDFVLYLNGRPLWNVRSEAVDLQRNRLEFVLARADTSRASWAILLGRPTSVHRDNIQVGVGYASRPALEAFDLAHHPPQVQLIMMETWRLWLGIIVLAFLDAAFLLMVNRSGIIRDSGPPKPAPGTNKPFSLGRLQMAIWFFLVLGAFIFLWIVTGDVGTINAQALVLIGIGTGTALGSAVVDATKGTSADEQLAALYPQQKKLSAEVSQMERDIAALAAGTPPAPAVAIALAEKKEQIVQLQKQIDNVEASQSRPVSEGFIKDVLTDANGISFHRFQMLAWTVVLGLLFGVGVWERLAMPEFNATMLALLGISAGTYLGFKIPEKQT